MDRDILQKNMLFLGIENDEPLELALVIRRNEDIFELLPENRTVTEAMI